VSIELPEALILARQMNEALAGKRVASCDLREAARLRRSGFVNQDERAFDALAGCRVREVVSRGNTILVRFDGALNLIVAPEYGGIVPFHAAAVGAGSSAGDRAAVGLRSKYHLKVSFDDESALTVRLTGMGGIQVYADNNIENSYMYRRDFLGAADPLDDAAMPESELARRLAGEGRTLKAVLLGKGAIVVGISNAAF
jgi:formamidopyrimidine-DNA glycosylase